MKTTCKNFVKLALMAVLMILTSCTQEMLKSSNAVNTDLLSESNLLTTDILTLGEETDNLNNYFTTILTSFDASLLQLPESIAVDKKGNIYVSMSPLREIWKLDAEGTFIEVFGNFEMEPGLFGVHGLRFDPRGSLYVAVSSNLPEINGVWEINSQGGKERIPGTGNIYLSNDIAVLPNGIVYITDSAKGAIWRYKPGGDAEVWFQNEALEGTGDFGLGIPIGANGIIATSGKRSPFAPQSNNKSNGGIIVANSEKGQLVYVSILPDGGPGEMSIIYADPDSLFGLDGITVDSRGNIYGAVNFGDKIIMVNGDRELSILSSGDPMDFPTSLAFGAGRDKHTLFITNFSVKHFLGDPPLPGDANPAIISLGIDP